VHPLVRFGHASFKLPTEAHPSSTENRGSGTRLGPTAPASHWWAIANVQDSDRSLSLSPLTIRANTGGKYPPFTVSSSPPRTAPPFLRRRLAIALPVYSLITLEDLLPSLVRSFCPSLHDHRARVSTSTTPPAADLRSMPVSSCSCASYCR
jgi:hypothetical protein